MRQQEDFRTTEGGAGSAGANSATPLFDDQSTLRAAPVVPLERVARRNRFAALTGNWRATVSTPQFRRSWPLALLLVATLAAAVAATSLYQPDDSAQTVAPAASAVTPSETAADARADAGVHEAVTPPSRGVDETSRESRGARTRRDAGNAAGAATPTDNTDALAASALGNVPDGGDGAGGGDDVAASSGDDQRRGGRDKGKRGERRKRHQNGRRGGGAVLFEVIR